MGCDSQSMGCAYLDQIYTSVGHGVDCGKKMVCKVTDTVSEGVNYVVEKVYGPSKEASQPSKSVKITPKANVTPSSTADGKGLLAKSAVSSGSGNKSSLNSSKNAVSCCGDNKYPEAAITGLKVVASVLVVVGVTQGVFFLYQWRKKNTDKK